MTTSLSRIETLDPREVWNHEARDFTPWLLENSDALASALGVDIELSATEHPVGGFSLDLIGRDLTNDCILIVENQLDDTNHDHLGKLVTYAAGTDAATVVWMARSFREEHRQALDWLNGLALGNARFFGVEIRAVRVDDSRPAPMFTLCVQPNDWHSSTAVSARAALQVDGKGSWYVEFWTRFLERVRSEHPDWTRSRKPSANNWLEMPCPWKGGPAFSSSFASGGQLRSELYIDFPGDSQAVAELFSYLSDRRDAIETTYGSTLNWEELPNRRASRIADYAEGEVTAKLAARSNG